MPFADNQDGWQLLVTLLWPLLQQYLKESGRPVFAWISEQTKHLNILLSAGVAFLTTIGLHWTWAALPDGSHDFHLVIPPVLAMGHVGVQWAIQHLEYRIALQPTAERKAIHEQLVKLNQVIDARLLPAVPKP